MILMMLVIENMFATAQHKLSEKKREAFINLIEEKGEHPFILECFAEYSKRKNNLP